MSFNYLNANLEHSLKDPLKMSTKHNTEN